MTKELNNIKKGLINGYDLGTNDPRGLTGTGSNSRLKDSPRKYSSFPQSAKKA